MTPPVPLWPFGVYALLVLGVIGGMLALSHVLGERHRGRVTGEPYESGSPLTGGARRQFSVQFYLMAVFFVIFDLETAFLFAWAVAAREAGWLGFIEASIFILVLLVALAYLWRQGALDWGTKRVRRRANGSDGGERP